MSKLRFFLALLLVVLLFACNSSYHKFVKDCHAKGGVVVSSGNGWQADKCYTRDGKFIPIEAR